MSSLDSTIQSEAAMYSDLSEYSNRSIKYVAERLESYSEQTNFIVRCFIGAIDKIGIIPGLIATALALSKVSESSGISVVEHLSIAILGLYLLILNVIVSTTKFKRYSFLFHFYLQENNNESS